MINVHQLVLEKCLHFTVLPLRLYKAVAVPSGAVPTTEGERQRSPEKAIGRRLQTFGGRSFHLVFFLSFAVLVADAKMMPASSRRTFICTARSRNSRLVLPEDGLCDIVFYDAACQEYGVDFRKFGVSNETKPFTAAAASSVKTGYGLGMCGQDPNVYIDELRSFTEFLSKSKSKIYHFAYLHITDRLGYDGDLFRLIFTVLKKLITAEISGFPKKRYGAIGMYLQTDEYILKMIDLMKNVYTPDAVIVYGHLLEDREIPVISQHCIFLPPNGFYRPASVYYDATYGHTVLDAASLAQRFWDAGVRISYSVAFTMGAAKVVVRYPDNRNPALGRYAVYQPCHYDKTRKATKLDFENPKAYCNNASVSNVTSRNLQYQESAETWVTFDKGRFREFAVAFDVADTLRFKVCRMALNHTRLKLSVTAADINLDGGASLCPKWKSGPMDRVKVLRSLQRFLASNSSHPAFLERCIRVNAK